MNAKFTALFVVITLLVPSLSEAGQAIGTAKARGDFRPYSQAQRSDARSVTRSRPSYRYSAPVVREAPSAVAQAPAQAPAEGRRFSQAPAANGQPATSAKPCSERASVASQPSSGRRYSYAPAPQYSGNPVRRYSGNVGHSSRPTWSLPKTDAGKYSTR